MTDFDCIRLALANCARPTPAAAPAPPAGSLVEAVAEALYKHDVENEGVPMPSYKRRQAHVCTAIAAVAGALRTHAESIADMDWRKTAAAFITCAEWLEREAGR